MCIQSQHLEKWEVSSPELLPSSDQINAGIALIESNLSVSLTDEYKNYLHFINARTCWCKEGNDFFLAKYNDATIKVLMSVMFPPDSVIELTKLLRESIYDHRTLLLPGLIVIGCDYDDEADAYLIYDTRVDSPTYKCIFHWRYYEDNLVVGDGLGFVAHSLKDFLQLPVNPEQLQEAEN